MDEKDKLRSPDWRIMRTSNSASWERAIKFLEGQMVAGSISPENARNTVEELLLAEYERARLTKVEKGIVEPDELENRLLEIRDDLSNGNPDPAAEYLLEKAKYNKDLSGGMADRTAAQFHQRLGEQYEALARAIHT